MKEYMEELDILHSMLRSDSKIIKKKDTIFSNTEYDSVIVSTLKTKSETPTETTTS